MDSEEVEIRKKMLLKIQDLFIENEFDAVMAVPILFDMQLNIFLGLNWTPEEVRKKFEMKLEAYKNAFKNLR